MGIIMMYKAAALAMVLPLMDLHCGGKNKCNTEEIKTDIKALKTNTDTLVSDVDTIKNEVIPKGYYSFHVKQDAGDATKAATVGRALDEKNRIPQCKKATDKIAKDKMIVCLDASHAKHTTIVRDDKGISQSELVEFCVHLGYRPMNMEDIINMNLLLQP